MRAHEENPPPREAALSVEQLTVRVGPRKVLDAISFGVQAGEVVGLLLKRTACLPVCTRALVDDRCASSGRVRHLGRRYATLDRPQHTVGVLTTFAGHPGRTVANHVRLAAARGGLEADRVSDVLSEAGLGERGGDRLRQLTGAQRQRLGIATALLGAPRVAILNDPATGLDPRGNQWLRGLLRDLAADGVAILCVCHPLSGVADDLDRALVLEDGLLIADASPAELKARAGGAVVVETPGAEVVAERLRASGVEDVSADEGEVRATGISVAAVGRIAHEANVPVERSTHVEPSLDEAVTAVTDEARNGGEPPPADGNGGRARPAADADWDERLAARYGRETEGPGADVMVVASPVPQQGVTTLTTAVADVLAGATDAAVVAVALSCDGGAIAGAVPVEERSALDAVDLAGDAPSFGDRGELGPYVARLASGAHALAGPAEADRLATLDAAGTEALLRCLGRAYDVVVVDVGPALPVPAAQAVARAAKAVVLVGTPDAGAALAADSPLLDVLETEHAGAATLVLNRLPDATVASGDDVLVPEDPALPAALGRSEHLLDDLAPATRAALQGLTARLVQEAPA